MMNLSFDNLSQLLYRIDPGSRLFLSLKFNLSKDSSKNFYHHPLKKHGYLMTSETLDKMTFNCVIMIKFNLYIPPSQA